MRHVVIAVVVIVPIVDATAIAVAYINNNSSSV